jgi:hypothetical protein
MILSIRYLFETGTLAFAIGGWIGLAEYENAISTARAKSQAAILCFLSFQLLGGVIAFLAFRRRGKGIIWLPLFLLGFCAAYCGCDHDRLRYRKRLSLTAMPTQSRICADPSAMGSQVSENPTLRPPPCLFACCDRVDR